MCVNRRNILISIVFFCMALFYTPEVQAQSFFSGPSIAIETTPRDPLPESSVTLELRAGAVNFTGATVRWFVDDIELVSARDSRSATITTKGVGEGTTVIAVIERAGQSPLTAELTITPSDVDLVIETDTYVPSFYKGRSLPSPGSLVRVTALTHLGNTPQELYYLWKLNGSVLQGGVVKNTPSIEFLMPRYESPRLSVTVSDAEGNRIAGKTITVQSVSPELIFYKDRALLGLEKIALPSSMTLYEPEVTYVAAPYYVEYPKNSLLSPLTWTLNGEDVPANAGNPLELTIVNNNGSGKAVIGAAYTDTSNYQQSANASFNVEYYAQ